jgi:hypothetical protein
VNPVSRVGIPRTHRKTGSIHTDVPEAGRRTTAGAEKLGQLSVAAAPLAATSIFVGAVGLRISATPIAADAVTVWAVATLVVLQDAIAFAVAGVSRAQGQAGQSADTDDRRQRFGVRGRHNRSFLSANRGEQARSLADCGPTAVGTRQQGNSRRRTTLRSTAGRTRSGTRAGCRSSAEPAGTNR